MLNKKLTITFNEFKLIGWMNRMKWINLYKINEWMIHMNLEWIMEMGLFWMDKKWK